MKKLSMIDRAEHINMSNNTINFKVYIIIVNWNGWKDTIECLESVLRNTYDNYQVIVCDNNSSDNSLEKIIEWTLGATISSHAMDEKINQYTMPSIKKPISYTKYTYLNIKEGELKDEQDNKVILIDICKNLGFAGGNNVGVQYAYLKADFKYIWFLNNDTVIHFDALKNLLAESEKNMLIGIAGSKLMYYDSPEKIQALAGCYNRFLGISRHIMREEDLKKMDYIVGAAMFVSKQFLNTVGPMSEEYFLYYEEMDWAIRNNQQFQLVCVLESVVYHKEGATLGGRKGKVARSEIADYYSIRNRVLFTKKYFPRYLIFVYLGLLVTIINRIRRRQYKRIKMIIKIIFKM